MLTPGVDTFATLAELRARASDYGATLPALDLACEALLRRAAEQMGAWRWQGQRTRSQQPLAWPRRGIRGVACDVIPLGVKWCQCALAAELHADDLDPPELRRGPVVRERVDVLEVEYAALGLRTSGRRASQMQAAPYLRQPVATVVRS